MWKKSWNGSLLRMLALPALIAGFTYTLYEW